MNPKFAKRNKAPIAWESLKPTQSSDFKNILKIDKSDIIISIIAFATTIITWISFKYFSNSFSLIYTFWDSSDPVIYTIISSRKSRGHDLIYQNFNNKKYTDVLNPLPVQRLIFSWLVNCKLMKINNEN